MTQTVNELNDVIGKLQTIKDRLNSKPEQKCAALLIGINYTGTTAQLNGCINDVVNVKNMLMQQFGYKEEDIHMLTDTNDAYKHPTKQNILDELSWLVNKNHDGFQNIFFHFSGHGTYINDHTGEERDKKDECLVPSDYSTSGLITDDVLECEFVSKLKDYTHCIAITDACHSGTQFDLKYKYNGGKKNYRYNSKSDVSENVKMITLSGCKDSQTSDDAYYNGAWTGALTKFFLETLKEVEYSITCYTLLRKLKYKLRLYGHTQIPQIGCTYKLKGTSVFMDNEL